MNTRSRTVSVEQEVCRNHPENRPRSRAFRGISRLGVSFVLAIGVFVCAVILPASADAAAPGTRYQQTDSHMVKVGTWSDFTKAEASGASYGRSNSSNASATIYFTGTRLDWIAMTGSTPGIVDVYLDDVWQTTIDLYSSPAHYQAVVWSSGTISDGPHKVGLRRSDSSAAGEYITLDAVDIWGTIDPAPDPPTRYQQTDSHIVKVGTWSDFTKAEASGASYGRSSSSNASATIYFTGTRLDWIAMTGSTPGIVDVYLDDVWQTTIDLYSSPAHYQAVVWSSGTISDGPHKVGLRRSDSSAAGEYITLDAVDIWGTIESGPDTDPDLVAKAVKASWLEGYLTGLTSRLAPYSAYICEEAETYNVPVQLALTFFRDENGWWRESYCTQFPRSWENKNIGNLTFAAWEAERYPGTALESGHSSNVFAAFPTVEDGIDAWFYLMRVRNATYSAGVDQIIAGDIQGGFETILNRYAPSAGAARVSSDVAYYTAISDRIAAEYGYVGGPDPRPATSRPTPTWSRWAPGLTSPRRRPPGRATDAPTRATPRPPSTSPAPAWTGSP